MKRCLFPLFAGAALAVGLIGLGSALADPGGSTEVIFRDRNYSVRLEVVALDTGSDIEVYIQGIQYDPNDSDFDGSIQAYPHRGYIAMRGASYSFSSLSDGRMVARVPRSEFAVSSARIQLWIVDSAGNDLWNDAASFSME